MDDKNTQTGNKRANSPYMDFIGRLRLFIGKNPNLIVTTLGNIFSMRLIGNKTHGDLAEIGIAEFINQFMYDFKASHVGKDLFRSKEHEEDIRIVNEMTKEEFPVSLKAYGNGPLQLSTDKNTRMFPTLAKYGAVIEGAALGGIWNDSAFAELNELNILPLIYDEKKKPPCCNILVFNAALAKQNVKRIALEDSGRGRKHPVYRFTDGKGNYVCEVRYGDAAANALQRGLWTHTQHGSKYFESVTSGWIDYSHQPVLVELFSHALVSTVAGHREALEILKNDIENQKRRERLV